MKKLIAKAILLIVCFQFAWVARAQYATEFYLTTLRLGLSFASLWGVISFSISGFSFPVMAMNPVLQALSNLFPLP